jgi:hypothetical protein
MAEISLPTGSRLVTKRVSVLLPPLGVPKNRVQFNCLAPELLLPLGHTKLNTCSYPVGRDCYPEFYPRS